MADDRGIDLEFLAAAVHELRTPLTSILGYSEMLNEGLAGPLNAEQAEFVATIRTKGEQLLRLVSSLMDIVELDSAKPALEPSVVDVRALLQEVTEMLTHHARRAEVTLAIDLPSAPPEAWTDPERLRAIVLHLVDNAVKFSRRRGTVTLGAVVEDADGDGLGPSPSAAKKTLVLRVTDTGIGIARDRYDRIFEVFYQVDRAASRKLGGSGLGLAIAKRLAGQLGARIRVTSTLGEGSTFEVVVPLAPPPGSAP